MAGKGFRDNECKDSIIQFERTRDLKATREPRLSGTSVKRFVDKSSECKVLATGARLDAVREVRELSARQRCRRNLHLVGGRKPARRFGELLFRWGPEVSLEFELPDPVRLMRLVTPLL